MKMGRPRNRLEPLIRALMDGRTVEAAGATIGIRKDAARARLACAGYRLAETRCLRLLSAAALVAYFDALDCGRLDHPEALEIAQDLDRRPSREAA